MLIMIEIYVCMLIMTMSGYLRAAGKVTGDPPLVFPNHLFINVGVYLVDLLMMAMMMKMITMVETSE